MCDLVGTVNARKKLTLLSDSNKMQASFSILF